MEKLPKDMIIYLAMEMELPEILSFCKTSKKTNERVCKDNNFWRNKIKKDRPNLLDYLSEDEKNYRKIYERIYESKFNNVITFTEDGDIIKGDFEDFGDSWESNYCEECKVGQTVWLFSSNNDEYYPKTIIFEKERAINWIVDEIRIRFENDDILIDFNIDEKLTEIRKNFVKNDEYIYDFEYMNLYFTLKKVVIV